MIAVITAPFPRDLHKVSVIKIIRAYTGKGLKEAKEIVDEMVASNRAEFELTSYANGKFEDLRDELQAEGVTIIHHRAMLREYQVYADDIRSLAAQAILSGHDDLAKDLQHIISTYGMKKSVDRTDDDATLVE